MSGWLSGWSLVGCMVGVCSWFNVWLVETQGISIKTNWFCKFNSGICTRDDVHTIESNDSCGRAEENRNVSAVSPGLAQVAVREVRGAPPDGSWKILSCEFKLVRL